MEHFVMPRPYLGQAILWSYNTKDGKVAALVTGVGNDSVSALLHVKDVKDHIIKTGVRHVNDPFLRRFPQHDGGCWDFTDWDKRILKMVEGYESTPEIEIEVSDDEV